ncbi:MAG: hypothetical protein U9Q08_04400 [Candidatus Omnitrophota bacterium]|nr:hypothetical protein [Candidatus Omnitrophota bacterium]
MMKKLWVKRFLCGIFFLSTLLIFNNLYADEQIMELNLHRQRAGGWFTISGILVWIEMNNFEEIDWKELAVKDSEGKITILIGSLVSGLKDHVGKFVTVTGIMKPEMQAKGGLAPVLEIRFIDAIE